MSPRAIDRLTGNSAELTWLLQRSEGFKVRFLGRGLLLFLLAFTCFGTVSFAEDGDSANWVEVDETGPDSSGDVSSLQVEADSSADLSSVEESVSPSQSAELSADSPDVEVPVDASSALSGVGVGGATVQSDEADVSEAKERGHFVGSVSRPGGVLAVLLGFDLDKAPPEVKVNAEAARVELTGTRNPINQLASLIETGGSSVPAGEAIFVPSAGVVEVRTELGIFRVPPERLPALQAELEREGITEFETQTPQMDPFECPPGMVCGSHGILPASAYEAYNRQETEQEEEQPKKDPAPIPLDTPEIDTTRVEEFPDYPLADTNAASIVPEIYDDPSPTEKEAESDTTAPSVIDAQNSTDSDETPDDEGDSKGDDKADEPAAPDDSTTPKASPSDGAPESTKQVDSAKKTVGASTADPDVVEAIYSAVLRGELTGDEALEALQSAGVSVSGLKLSSDSTSPETELVITPTELDTITATAYSVALGLYGTTATRGDVIRDALVGGDYSLLTDEEKRRIARSAANRFLTDVDNQILGPIRDFNDLVDQVLTGEVGLDELDEEEWEALEEVRKMEGNPAWPFFPPGDGGEEQ